MLDKFDDMAIKLAVGWWDLNPETTPEEIRELANQEHFGDCTKQPCACVRCQGEQILLDSRPVAQALRDVQRETAKECAKFVHDLTIGATEEEEVTISVCEQIEQWINESFGLKEKNRG